MAIRATIISDRISEDGHRLTSVECEFHRFILPEIAQHRVLSRSSSSSRAVGIKKNISMVEGDIAFPIEWGLDAPGMQAKGVLDSESQMKADYIWERAAKDAIIHARSLAKLGVHKQLVNRLLEPFAWQTTLLTGTNWENFFKLRLHPDAQPEFERLALNMKKAMRASIPKIIHEGEWTLPYVTAEEEDYLPVDVCKQISVTRCARTSYLPNRGEVNVEADLELFQRLAKSSPPHAAPFEPIATPSSSIERGNFAGYRQFRHDVEEEVMYDSWA